MELGLITGVLVGMTVGGVYGSAAYDCDVPNDDCLLSREMESMLFSAMGGSLGGIIGMGTSYLLNRRPAPALAAPVGVAPAAQGGMSVGVTLRH